MLSPLAPSTFVESTKTWIQNPDLFPSLESESPPLTPPPIGGVPSSFLYVFQFPDTKSDPPIRPPFKNLDTKSDLSLFLGFSSPTSFVLFVFSFVQMLHEPLYEVPVS